MLHSAQTVDYPVFNAGIDWLTCTAKNGSPAFALERVADMQVDIQRSRGVRVTNQSWLGFTGYKLPQLFFGRREHDVMLCLSGALSDSIGLQAIACSSNVSRLDLQVTIFTAGEVASLGRAAWSRCRQIAKGKGRPRSFSLIVGHPEGETFYVNSRSSDNFGRVYDKGVESKLGPAGMLWRYEVEFKRKVAKQEAAALPPQEQLGPYVSDRVRSWMTLRDLEPPWEAGCWFGYEHRALEAPDRDVLAWYDRSVSVSIGKAVKEFGLKVVLERLGLLKLVNIKEVT